jgi:hypothetical protein
MSAIISAFGNLYAGEAQANAYSANAEQKRIEGLQQRNISLSKAQAQGQDQLRQRGAIVAAYGASGVTPGGGTPLEVMADHATHGELMRQSMLWQGLADQQSSNQQAAIYRKQATAARNAGYISAAGSLVSGAEKAYMAAGKG